MGSLLTPLDYIIFIGSLLTVMAIGLWVGRKEETSKDYFLAGRNARWWGVAGSIFGSNVSANHLVGMMGVGFAFGFAQSHFEITAIAGLLMLCYFLLPVYRKLNIYTLSEYLSRRYDDRCRVAYAVIMITIIVFVMTVPAFYIGSRSINLLLMEDTGQKAVAEAVVAKSTNGVPDRISGVVIRNAGRQYETAPIVEISPPAEGTVAVATAEIANGPIGAVVIKDGGSGYDTDSPPSVTLDGNGGAQLQAVVKVGVVTAVQILDGGAGYDQDSPPTMVISSPANGRQAQAFTAVVEKGVRRIDLVEAGSGYTTPPALTIIGGARKADLSPGDVDPIYYILGILVMALITGTYTIVGGLRAVIVTDVIQSLLMLVGGLVLAFFMFNEIGGWNVMATWDLAVNGGQEKLHLYNAANHPTLPWSGVLTGLMVLHFYYWGANQFIVQRALAASTDKEARMGIISAGFLKLLIPFFSIGCGIAAWYYYADRAQVVAQDAVFMQLLGDLVPVGFGLMGLVAAGVFGAILSSIDSMLNSGATLVTFDFYKKYRNPKANDKQLIRVGRLWVMIFLVASAVMTIFTADPNSEDSFFLQIAEHQSKLIAGVVVAFFLGLVWKGATAAGGLTAIISGILFSYLLPHIYAGWAGEGLKAVFGSKLNFMHSVFIAALIALFFHIAVSLGTRTQKSDKQNRHLTWIGLGIFTAKEFKYFGIKLAGALALYAILAITMMGGMLNSLAAGLIAALWTWVMFLDSVFKSLLHAATRGRAYSLLKEDRFWGGLLAACAVFMLFYFY